MNKELIIKKIIIESFENIKNYLIIKYKNKPYYLPIKNGSVDIIVKNSDGEEVGLKYLEIGDNIKFKAFQDNENKIIIKKIYISTKYRFNSESSEDLDLF
jgi:hypothetical protein|tara:strand:- start:4987 stop:5286 length:300 start_codon:yes stop_codon:yes gene_type:complete